MAWEQEPRQVGLPQRGCGLPLRISPLSQDVSLISVGRPLYRAGVLQIFPVSEDANLRNWSCLPHTKNASLQCPFAPLLYEWTDQHGKCKAPALCHSVEPNGVGSNQLAFDDQQPTNQLVFKYWSNGSHGKIITYIRTRATELTWVNHHKKQMN